MKTDELKVANMKCNGCASTIIKELMKIDGVSEVTVDKENDMVVISHNEVERKVLTAALLHLGYPEATEKNGLLLQLKSMQSCVIGKINAN